MGVLRCGSLATRTIGARFKGGRDFVVRLVPRLHFSDDDDEEGCVLGVEGYRGRTYSQANGYYERDRHRRLCQHGRCPFRAHSISTCDHWHTSTTYVIRV
jgi:hypothetical protein